MLVTLIISLAMSIFAFAQGDDLLSKLQIAKDNNDLSAWIYEQLDAKTALKDIQDVYKNAWRKPQNADEHYAWLNLINSIGYAQLLSGNILAAIDSYESAFSYYNQHKILNYDIVEYTLKPLSNNYTRLGDYEKAIFLQQKAINILAQQQADVNQTVAMYSNMAISYRAMGELVLAEETIEKALALKPTGTANIIANNVLADILYDAGRYTEAEFVILQNIKKQRSNNADAAFWLMSSYATAGAIMLEKKNHSSSEAFFKKSIALLEKFYPTIRIRERANLYTQLSKSLSQQRKFTEARNYLYKTLKALGIAKDDYTIRTDKIFGDNKVVDGFVQLAKISAEQHQDNKALVYLNFALQAADLIRAEFTADLTKERLQKSIKNIIEDAISLNYQLFQKTKNKTYLKEILNLSEQSKARTLAEQIQRNRLSILQSDKNDSLIIKRQRLERAILYQEKLAIEEPKVADAKALATFKYDLALVNKSIEKKYPKQKIEVASSEIKLETLPTHHYVVYFFGTQHLYAVVINQQQIRNVIRIPNAKKLNEMLSNYVNTYFQNGPSAMLNHPKGFYNAAYDVYRNIVLPLKLSPNTKVTVIPDGLLGYISFDGLVSSQNYVENIAKWPFLIRSNSIDYAFSLQTSQTSTTNTKRGNFSGLFISHSKNANTALVSVNKEAENIQKFVKGDFYLNDAAKANTFEQLFTRSDVLHIGTHAYLSGKNAEPTLDFGKEKFYLFELSAKRTAPLLVLLSACKTADGELSNGEGIISLARGFKAVGTNATIASLWNVNDATAASISSNFYRFLDKNTTAAEALRKSKLDWLNGTKNNAAMLLPYYWDSLVYVGDDQFLNLPKPINWAFWGIIFGIGIVIFSLATLIKQRKKH